jgi:hypothetical protein
MLFAVIIDAVFNVAFTCVCVPVTVMIEEPEPDTEPPAGVDAVSVAPLETDKRARTISPFVYAVTCDEPSPRFVDVAFVTVMLLPTRNDSAEYCVL